MKHNKVFSIVWSENHETIVSLNTRGRRSRWTRRLVRAARRGDLKLAWKILTRGYKIHAATLGGP